MVSSCCAKECSLRLGKGGQSHFCFYELRDLDLSRPQSPNLYNEHYFMMLEVLRSYLWECNESIPLILIVLFVWWNQRWVRIGGKIRGLLISLCPEVSIGINGFSDLDVFIEWSFYKFCTFQWFYSGTRDILRLSPFTWMKDKWSCLVGILYSLSWLSNHFTYRLFFCKHQKA